MGKIVVIGGHDTFLKTLRKELPGNVKYIDREKHFDSEVIRNADSIWVQSNAMSHAQWYKVMKYARLYKKPVGFLNYASASKCAAQIMGG